MNARERVLRAVNFQKSDRAPIDLGAIRASGISAVVYDKLKARMGIHTPTKIHDTMQILAEVELEVLDRLHVDVAPLDASDAAWVRRMRIVVSKSGSSAGWMSTSSLIRILQKKRTEVGYCATPAAKRLR